MKKIYIVTSEYFCTEAFYNEEEAIKEMKERIKIGANAEIHEYYIKNHAN